MEIGTAYNDKYIDINGFLLNTSQKKDSKEIYINNKTYYRFMDWIYSPKPINDLSIEEVNQICEIRRKHSYVIDVAIHKKIIAEMLQTTEEYIDSNSCLSILDFGSGNGIYYNQLSGFFKNSTIYCCDMNEDAILNNPANYKYIINPFGPLPFDSNMFDIIYMFFVMHFRVPTSIIKEVHRCLSPTGYFIYNIYGNNQDKKDTLMQDNKFIKICEKDVHELNNHNIKIWKKSDD